MFQRSDLLESEMRLNLKYPRKENTQRWNWYRKEGKVGVHVHMHTELAIPMQMML